MSLASLLVPDFIIIGAMKSGTTTLYRLLAEHPGIDMSRDKETDFFVAEKNWSLGPEWYSRQFSQGVERKRGEASPNYTKRRDFPGVPERMARHCPNARLIYLVRDPVERALSQFRHSFLMGTLAPDMQRFADSHEYAHIMDASLYAHQLDAYLAHFPKAAIEVLDFDDLVRDPQGVMNSVADHVGVAPHPVRDWGAMNDSAELSRVPAPILRFAQSHAGRAAAGLIGRDMRDRLRGAFARGTPRRPPPFPDALLDRMRQDLAADSARFRQMTGMALDRWSV